MQQFIAYLRVSTSRQGKSGLGLDAQKSAIAAHLGNARPLASYTEVESGRKSNRVELRKALDHCHRSNATLIISKLDRLTRSARFLLELVDSGVDIVFCDLPQISGPTGRFMLASMANVAELEAAMISQRTRDALQAAKARGKRLGARPGASPLSAYLREHGNKAGLEGKAKAANRRAEPWRAILSDMLDQRLSYGGIARELNARGERTPSGSRWSDVAVSRMAKRLELTATRPPLAVDKRSEASAAAA